MKKRLAIQILAVACLIGIPFLSIGQSSEECLNIDFSDDFNGWSGFYGTFSDPDKYSGRIETNGYSYPSAQTDQTDNRARHLIVDRPDYSDGIEHPHTQYLGDLPLGMDRFVRLGNFNTNYHAEVLEYTFTVQANLPVFGYDFAVVLQSPQDHGNKEPSFSLEFLNDQGNPIGGANTNSPYRHVYDGNPGHPGFESIPDDGGQPHLVVMPWRTEFVDLSNFVGQQVTLRIMTRDCNRGGHFGYAYFSGFCSRSIFRRLEYEACSGIGSVDLSSEYPQIDDFTQYIVETEDVQVLSSDNGIIQYYLPPGGRTGRIVLNSESFDDQYDEVIIELVPGLCDDGDILCPSFYLEPEKEYYLSYWVKNETKNLTTGNGIVVLELMDADSLYSYKGPYETTQYGLNQWKQNEVSFITPADPVNVRLRLLNAGDGPTYFDDIRIIPINSNAVSYVYDPETRRLTAELDANNYPTFYEYDNEGNLVRIKKETETGIHTIQEGRLETVKVRP